jgi:hypothetical protein
MITASGGITTATDAMTMAAILEYRSTTAQDNTNKPMQIVIRAR